MKILLKTALVTSSLYALLNYSWVHAASIAMISDACDDSLLAQSRTATSRLFGAVTSTPIIRCVDGPKLGQHVRFGRTNFALGLSPVILIGPEGNNADVIAHEWGHAELFERVGLYHREFLIPTWLDEGVAMQLDNRMAYNHDALLALQERPDLQFPDLSAIASADFFVPGDQGKYHYAYSKCIVRKWLEDNDDWLVQLEELNDELPESIRMAVNFCDS